MTDSKDDLDLELEADMTPPSEPAQPSEKSERTPAKAAAARKPNAVARVTAKVSGKVDSITHFRWDLRTFAYLLVAFLLLALLVENWVPTRMYIFGWRFELPRALGFLIDLAIGAGLLLLWQKRNNRPAESEK